MTANVVITIDTHHVLQYSIKSTHVFVCERMKEFIDTVISASKIFSKKFNFNRNMYS